MIWFWRGGFALLIALSVLWKLADPPPPKHSNDPAVYLARVWKGRQTGPVVSQPWGRGAILSAPVAGCKIPLVVVTMTPSFSAEEAVEVYQPAGGHPLFVYLDWMSDRSDRWGLLRRRIRENIESLLGVSPYRLPDIMLFVGEAPGCSVARTMPWRRFWDAR